MPRVHELTDELIAFWRERHLCTVTTLRADGSPHVVPMGVVLDVDARVAWAITSGASQKVDLTMAYVGTRSLFERVGFVKAADTSAVSGGFPRVIMRLAT